MQYLKIGNGIKASVLFVCALGGRQAFASSGWVKIEEYIFQNGMGNSHEIASNKTLFNDITREVSSMEDLAAQSLNDMIVNLYLVSTGARKAYLTDMKFTPQNEAILFEIVKKHRLYYMEDIPGLYVISKTFLPKPQNEASLGDVLGYPCKFPDPSTKVREGFSFMASKNAETFYITAFVCFPEEAHAKLETIKQMGIHFQSELEKVDRAFITKMQRDGARHP